MRSAAWDGEPEQHTQSLVIRTGAPWEQVAGGRSHLIPFGGGEVETPHVTVVVKLHLRGRRELATDDVHVGARGDGLVR